MSVTSWTATAMPAPEGPVHVVATEFHLPAPARHPAVPALHPADHAVAARGRGPGRLRSSGPHPPARYRTVSAWSSPDAARRFARSGAHGEIAGVARAGSQPKSVARWDAPASETPPSWAYVEEVLTAASSGVTSPSGRE